ncbi:hypothetical protein P7C71_g3645, partial [Lecanoromycetidae sp. Uapishka_2]
MSGSFEKSVKGGTKIKLAPPKAKYVEHILIATHAGDAGVAEIFRALQHRLRDSTWTIVFKALIIVHLMVREGEPNVTLKFVAESPSKLAISNFSDEHYFEMSKFDAERALAIYKTFTRQTNNVVEFLSTARQYENATRLEIPKLKHAPTSLTSSLEEYLNDPDFEVNRRQYLAQQEAKKGGKSTTNGATASKNYFAKATANSGGGASKGFPEPKTAQAAPSQPAAKGPAPDLIDFFDSIEQNQQPMASAPQQQQQQVPNFGVGPQYQQQQQLQQTGVLPQQQPDFFGQQPQAQNSNGFGNSNPFGQPQQQPPLQPDFTGAGFGGYGQQPYAQQQDAFSSTPQNNTSQFSQQQQPFSTGQQSFNTGQPQQPFSLGQQQPMTTGSNPFRQSMMPQATEASQTTFSNAPALPASPQTYQVTGNNPFARNLAIQQTGPPQNSPFATQQGSPFTSPPPQQPQATPFTSPPTQPQQQQQPASMSMTPQRTGTNPFARTPTAPQTQSPFPSASPLVASPTGSTNPFRQSAFVNQQTGQGWQSGQGTMGGFEQLPTMPVFPRPGQSQQQQQGAWP